MGAGMGVGGGVSVWRVVAATDVAARPADSKVQPWFIGKQAVLAAIDRVRERCDQDLVEMCAGHHGASGPGWVSEAAP